MVLIICQLVNKLAGRPEARATWTQGTPVLLPACGRGVEGVADMACRGSTEAAAELEEDDAAAASQA